MCQVSAYVKQGAKEELLKENVTKLELSPGGLRMSTLFEGTVDLPDLVVNHIDFSAGKVVLENKNN
jgi:hypothetical protein